MPIITIRDLNKIGRTGNQFFLYVFAKAYAKKMSCELQCPDWFGRKLLVNANEPFISNWRLEQTRPENYPRARLGHWFGNTNIDILAYCQHQIYLDFYTRAQAREWLKLKPEFEAFAPQLPMQYSAAHLRRGDYVTDPVLRKSYCEVSDASYERAIEKFDIPEPIYRVQEGLRFPPQALVAQEVPWLEDFLLLRDAAHLLRANSSFSVWSSWLGNGKTYCPVVGSKVGLNDVDFVEGNQEITAGMFRNQSSLHLKEA